MGSRRGGEQNEDKDTVERKILKSRDVRGKMGVRNIGQRARTARAALTVRERATRGQKEGEGVGKKVQKR